LGDENSLFEYNTDQTYEIYDEKPIQTNYPNEFMNAFLASIKVFGYLDKPVFHELANQLQTRMLSKDEVLCRDKNNYSNDFITVVDGEVEVYIPKDNIGNGNKMVYNSKYNKTNNNNDMPNSNDNIIIEEETLSEYEEENNNHKIDDLEQEYDDINLIIDRDELESKYYQLTKVKTGGTLTSLFVILALLVDKKKNKNGTEKLNEFEAIYENVKGTENENVSNNTNTLQQDNNNETYIPKNQDYVESSEYSEAMISSFEYPTMYFKAKKRTTLAVIPEKAFIDLKQKYPLAVSHMIQVILTRFQRVTFLTLYKYLGLSDELIQVEKKVNEFISGGRLPEKFFPSGGLDSLRNNVKRLHHQKKTKSNENRKINKKDSLNTSNDNNKNDKINNKNDFLNISESTFLTVNKKEQKDVEENQEKWRNDEKYIKNSIFNEIAKYIGINDDISNINNFNASVNENIMKSPKSPNFEQINNENSELEPSETGSELSFISENKFKDEGSRFNTKININNNSYDSLNSHSNDKQISSSLYNYASKVELLYYPRGSILLNEGDKYDGLFFVIDGLIEGVSINKDEGLFNMSINSADQNIRNNRIHISSNREKENIHSKAQALFSKKMELNNRKRFNDRYNNNKYKSRLNNLIRKKPSNISDNVSDIGNHYALKSNDSKTINSHKSISNQYEKSDTGTLDGTTTELTFSTSDHKTLFYIKPGGLSCYFSILNDNQSYVTLKAKTDSYVGFLPKYVLERLCERYPSILETLARRLLSQLSLLIFHIDFSLEWRQSSAGQILCHEGDNSDAIYIVMSGRLRSVKKNKKKEGYTILNEFSQGEIVGETEVLTNSKRQSTIHAIRESEIAVMPKSLINSLAISHPEITLELSHIIAKRYMELQPNKDIFGQDFKRNNTKLRTIAILPISDLVPINDFSKRLYNALISLGDKVSYLNTATVISVLGKHAFNKLGSLKLNSWLSDQEASSRIVMCIADGGSKSSWTKRCILQADCIFLVGLGDGDPAISDMEKLLLRMKVTARRELVLLHQERYVKPGSTLEWLKRRKWISSHYHIQMPLDASKIIMKTDKNSKFNIIKYLQKYRRGNKKETFNSISEPFTGNRSDFARLGRRILSKSIGLVLGGGGARGLAQAGMIKVMEDIGIPIDMVGGVSIGSFIGGLYAQQGNLMPTLGKLKQFSEKMSSFLYFLLDLTYPITAPLSGREFNRGIWKAFKNANIEDSWIPFFCVTTNITWSRSEIHLSGLMWKYIRASMSLSGFLPPVCSEKGHLLMDGGYVNNLPADIMRNLGAKTVIAIDVGSEDDTTPIFYGDSLSGWKVLFSRMNPFGKKVGKLPTLTDIQSRLAYVACVKSLEEVKVMDGCYYLRPPVTSYGTLEFGKMKEISTRGTEYMEEVLKDWKQRNILENEFGMFKEKKRHGRRFSI
jgi:lysophospholipid hydrolase